MSEENIFEVDVNEKKADTIIESKIETKTESREELKGFDYDAYDVELNNYANMNMNMVSWSDYNSYATTIYEEYVKHPIRYHRELMDISEMEYGHFGQYGQTVSKMVSAPSLDAIIVPSRGKAKKNEDILNKAYDIIDRINHKLMSEDGIFNSILYGEYVAIWRDTKKKRSERPSEYAGGDKIEAVGYIDNMTLQPLDLKYCRFEGFANGDNVVSFDLSYFDTFRHSGSLVGEIKNYPKEFLLGYNMYRKDASKKWMLLPQETTFSYKFHGAVNEAHGRPLITFALEDIMFSEDYTEAKRGNLYENSNVVAYYILPEGERKGDCALNNDQQRESYKAFKGAINLSRSKRNIGKTIPLKLPQGSTIGKMEVNDIFLKDTLSEENASNISVGLGLGSGLFSCSGKDLNFSSLQMNLDLMLTEVYSILDQFSMQYTKLINNYLGLGYGDRLTFYYLHTSKVSSDKEYQKYKDLYTMAGGSRMYLYSVVSGNADMYMRMMEFENEMDYDEKFMPHLTSFTATDNADKSNADGNLGGRKKKDEKELSRTGEATRNNNLNDSVKPSTK